MGSAAADPSAYTPQSKETLRHAKLLAVLPAANLEMRICCAEPSRCRRGMDCSLQLLRHACWSDNPSLMHFTCQDVGNPQKFINGICDTLQTCQRGEACFCPSV